MFCIKDSHSCGSRYIGETNRNIQMLDAMNMITQIKIRNHGNTFETTSTTVLQGRTIILNASKNAKASKNLELSYFPLFLTPPT